MNKIILKYGFISGAIAAALMLGTGLYLHNNPHFKNMEVWGFAGMVLSMLFVFIGVRVYREEERNGSIGFGEAFKVGGIMALISCVCYAVAWMAVSEWLLPDFMNQYVQQTLDTMRANQQPEAEIQAAAADMAKYQEMYTNPVYKFLLTLMEPLPVAVVVSLLSALLLRRK